MARQIPSLRVSLKKWLPFTEVFHLLITLNEHIGIIVRRCTMAHYFPGGSLPGARFVVNFTDAAVE